MSITYGQPALTYTGDNKLHEDFIPIALLQPGVSTITADLTSSDVTIGTLAAPSGYTYFIPTMLSVAVSSKSGGVSVPAVINIGKTGANYDDMFAGVTVPTGAGNAVNENFVGLGAVYQNGDVIKMHKATALIGGPLVVAVSVYGYWIP